MGSLHRCLYLSVLLLSFCHGLYDTQPSFVVSMGSLYYFPLFMFFLYICHRLYDIPVAIRDLHDGALFVPWTALVVLPRVSLPVFLPYVGLASLLLCIYQMCLPLPVVLTPLLLTLCRLVYAAHCPRGIYGFLCLFYSSLSVFVCVASLCLFYCVPGLYLLVPCVRISCRNLADNRLCGAGYEPVSMLATPGCSSLPMVGLF